MRCPVCSHASTGVINSRPTIPGHGFCLPAEGGLVIRRYRTCKSCRHHFTTHEIQLPDRAAVIGPDGALLGGGTIHSSAYQLVALMAQLSLEEAAFLERTARLLIADARRSRAEAA